MCTIVYCNTTTDAKVTELQRSDVRVLTTGKTKQRLKKKQPVSVCLSVSACLSNCKPACLSVCLSVCLCLSLSLSLCLSLLYCLSVSLSNTHTHTHTNTHTFACLSVCPVSPSLCMFASLRAYLLICLFFRPSVCDTLYLCFPLRATCQHKIKG